MPLSRHHNYQRYEPETILEIRDGSGVIKSSKPKEEKSVKTKPPPKRQVEKDQSSYSVPLSRATINEMHEAVKIWSGPVGGGNPTIRAFIQEAISEKIARQSEK